MMDAADAMEDPPASQDAKTLVPMSLSLVAKKERILQTEVAKLEKRLAQRNDILCGLRESHEFLLTTNGQLQERNRLRREKLVSLRTLLESVQEHGGEDKAGIGGVVGMNELEATAEKCGVLKDILTGLVDKHTTLEQQCMGLEDRTSRETMSLRAKEERLSEVRCSLQLLHEDIRSAQWNFECDQVELNEEDKRLNMASQNAQREAATVEKITAALRAEQDAVGDLRTTWQNYRDMAHEEHRQLAIANEDAKSEQRKLHRMLESNGATCAADEVVLQAQKDLQSRLQHLNEEMASTTFFKRELALRKKQEKDMLAITQSSIKAKEDQLTWLERQRVHLENEHKEAAKAHAADENAYQALLKEHREEITSLEAQIKDAGKLLKATERAVSTRNKKVAAVNKKVAQKTKVLSEWQAKIDAKQEQVTKSAATQKLVDIEVLGLQEELEKENQRLERTQQMRAAQEMEVEQLNSSCLSLETDTQEASKTVAAMKSSIAAAQTAVKNRTDEIRDKFLNAFVVDDAEILIELLNKEIESWTTKDTDEIEKAVGTEASMLQQRYDELAADTRKKHSKVLKQKERKYNASVKKLKEKTAEKKDKIATTAADKPRFGEKGGNMKNQDRASPTVQRPENDENTEDGAIENTHEAESQDFDPPWLESRVSEGIANKAKKDSTAKKRSSNPKPTQRKASKKVPKSVRRLNLVDESPQTDNELADLVTAGVTSAATTEPDRSTFSEDHGLGGASWARRPRLKRRTAAQKSGKPAATARPSIEPTSASSKAPLLLNTGSATSIDHSNPAAEMANPIDSPAGCEDLEATRSALVGGDPTTAKKTSGTAAASATTQGAARKSQLHKVGQRSKGATKRRTSTKVSHRSRHLKVAKPGRISLGRSQAVVDWSAADSFSFD